MLHSVNVHDRIWPYPHLSVPLFMVDALFRYLRRSRYRTLFLDDWYERSGIRSDPKEIVLSFDDGYLDNWVYLYPMLEKYEIRATVFVNPEFVQPEGNPRPTLKDVWQQNAEQDHLADLGFLNWAEIQAMQNSPWVDIQSHSMSHTWYPTGPEVVGFHLPRLRGRTTVSSPPWIFWNERPALKPYYLNQSLDHLLAWGTPIFENERSLGVRRYFTDPGLIDRFLEAVAAEGVDVLFRPKRFEELSVLYRRTAELFPEKGRLETDDEMAERYTHELIDSKRVLEERLGKPVSFLCWAGGANNELSVSLSIEGGYLASTLPSRERGRLFDNSGAYKRIARQSMGGRLGFMGRRLGLSWNRKKLIHSLDNSPGIGVQIKLEKLVRMMLQSIGS